MKPILIERTNDADVANKVNFCTDVIYHIITDRFFDGDPGNNPDPALMAAPFRKNGPVEKKYYGGDWQGIIDKIEDGYLTDMGVTALYISPPVENVFCSFLFGSEVNTSYHGYWARDFKKTNPFFGDFALFRRMVDTAHQHGMKVVFDFAPNHTSPASIDDPSYGENGRLYDNGRFIGGYSNDKNGYFLHNGGTSFDTYEHDVYKNLYDLASFNFIHPEIDTYMKEAIELWLDAGIDGIRMDAVKHVPFGWLKNFVSHITAHQSVFIFGEWFLKDGVVDNDNQLLANETGMSLLDFRFADRLREIFRVQPEKGTFRDLNKVIIDSEKEYECVHDQVIFIDNHDIERFHTKGARKRMMNLALVVLLTSRGVPCIYYGTEQYMTGNTEPANREPMTSFSRKTKAYRIIRKLSSMRKQNPALAYGQTKALLVEDDVFVFERSFASHVVLVAINTNPDVAVELDGLATSLPKGTYRDALSGMLRGDKLSVSKEGNIKQFILKPGAACVWQAEGQVEAPVIGHLAPKVVQPGAVITVSGRGLGQQPGTVYVGDAALDGSSIIGWSDSQVRFALPPQQIGHHPVRLETYGGGSCESANGVRILSGLQTVIRFIVDEAFVESGEQIYLLGNVTELGEWNAERAIGPFFNEVEYQYPTWYYDVSVPVGVPLEFRFVKKDEAHNASFEQISTRSLCVTETHPVIFRCTWDEAAESRVYDIIGDKSEA